MMLALLVFSTTAFGGDRKRQAAEAAEAEMTVLRQVRCVSIRENAHLLKTDLAALTALVGEAYRDVEEQAQSFDVEPEAFQGDTSLSKKENLEEFNRTYTSGEARRVMMPVAVTNNALDAYNAAVFNIDRLEEELEEKYKVKLERTKDKLPLDDEELAEITAECPRQERVRLTPIPVTEDLRVLPPEETLPDGLPPKS